MIAVNAAWTAKAYSLFDTLLWIACLNLLWIAFTLGGLVIFGAGPSTVAAHELVRRRVRGDVAPLIKAFWHSYTRNFVRGNILGLTLIFVGTMLAANWRFFSVELTFTSQLIAIVVAVLAVIFLATVCYAFPMYVRYELPVFHYLLQSSRFALRNLAGTVLLLLVTAAVAFASFRLPGLIPFFSVGAWMYLTGWLCEKFYAANEVAMATAEQGAPPVASTKHPVRQTVAAGDWEKVAKIG